MGACVLDNMHKTGTEDLSANRLTHACVLVDTNIMSAMSENILEIKRVSNIRSFIIMGIIIWDRPLKLHRLG